MRARARNLQKQKYKVRDEGHMRKRYVLAFHSVHIIGEYMCYRMSHEMQIG